MVDKLSERKKRETEAIRSGNTNKVSDTELFAKMGVKIKRD